MGKGMTVSELREFQRKQDEKWRNGQAYKKREEERRRAQQRKVQNISKDAMSTIRGVADSLVRQRNAQKQQENPFAGIGIYAQENTGLGGSAPVLTEGKKQATNSPDLEKTAEFQQLREEFLKPYETAYNQAKNEQDKANSEASKSRSGDMYGWDSLAAQKYEEARKNAPEQGSKVHKLLSEQIDRFNTGQEKAKIASEKSAQAAKAKADKDSAENAFDAAALQRDVENDPSFPAYVEKGTKEISKLKSYLEKSTGEKMVEIGLTNDDKLHAYLTINDNELNTYFALNGKYGETIANRYLDSITPDLEERAAGMIYESVEGMEDGPAQKLARLGVTVAGAGQNVRRNILNLGEGLTGGEDVIAPGTMQKAKSQISENLEGVEKVVNDIADSAVNMAPALAVSTIPGVGPYASAAMTGATSYSGNYSDAILSGYTPEQAASFAIPAAASESLMQYAIGGISKMGGSNSLTNTVKNAMNRVITNPTAQNVLGKAAQAGGEALEEYLQANVEPVLRNLALGENNEINPISEDKAYAALLGGIMGGGIDIATDVAGRTARRSAQAEAKANEIMDRNGITRTYNPHETVRLANGTEAVVVSRDGGEYVIAEAGKSGYSRVAAEDIAGKVSSTSPTADQYIPPERKVRQNEKYDARHVEKTADKVFLDKLMQGRGIKAVVEDMQPGAEAFYDRSTNTIHFAPDSTRAEVIGGVTAHELAHAAEGSPNYAKYSDYVMEKLFAGDSAALAQAVEAKQEQYISRGIDLSDADAAAEIVADYTRQLYKSEADIDALVTGNRSMAQSIYDSIKTAIRKIRAFFKGDSATLANIREYQELQRAQKLFERALSTRENMQAEAALAYALNKYSEHQKDNWRNSKSIEVYENEAQFKQFIQDALNDKNLGKKMYFGAIPEDLANRINQETGVDVANYNCSISSYEIKKIFKDHGNEATENLRGQRAITEDDLLNIPIIIQSPDNIVLSPQTYNGRPVLLFEKEINGRTVVTAYTSQKHHDLSVQTMFAGKNKGNLATPMNDQAFINTPEANNSTVSTDIIPQSDDNVNRQYSINNEVESAEVLTENPERARSSLRQRAAENWDFFKRKAVDSGATIDRLGKETGDPQLYTNYNAVRHARGMGSIMIGGRWLDSRQHGAQYDFNMNKVGKSLDNIFRPVRDKGQAYTQDFFTYLLHEHNIDRMAQGKPVFSKFMTAEKSRNAADTLLKKHPEFTEMAKDVWKFNDNNLQYRVDAGLITQEAADAMREMYPHYVPTYREQPTMRGGGNRDGKVRVNTGVKSATGSDMNILPIDEMMARQTMQMTNAAALNVFGNRLLDLANSGREGVGKYVSSIKTGGKEFDIDADPANERTMKNQFTVYQNGIPHTLTVSDGIFEGIEAVTPKYGEANVIEKVFVKANDAFKRGITSYNPLFLLTNSMKDIQDGALYSTNARRMLGRYPKAFAEIAGNGEMFQKYLAAGGVDSSFFNHAGNFRQQRNKLAEMTVDKLEFANLIVEQAPRLAEFMSVYETNIKNGVPEREAISRAIYAADDITTNFGRSGTWGRVINRTAVPFFNAGVQGWDKLARTLTGSKSGRAWAGLAIKTAALGILPAILNNALYSDDDDYKHLDQYIRDNYYLYKLPSGKFLRIPKGRVLSLFGSVTDRFIQWLNGDDKAWDGYIQNAASQVAPANPITNNLFSAFTQIASNRAWHGGEIENQQMQDIQDLTMRYDETTSEIAKTIGKALGMSPVQIDYLLDQYTGVFGDILLPLTTPAAEQNPVEKKFIADPAYASDYSDAFYSARNELEKTIQAEQRAVPEEERIPTQAALANKYLSTVSAQVSELYNEIDRLQADEYLDDATKLAGVRELREKINELQDNAVKQLPEMQEAIGKYYSLSEDISLSEDDLAEKYYIDPALSGEERARKIKSAQEKSAGTAYARALKDVFGADTGMSAYGKDAYEKAQNVVSDGGITMEQYFDYYTNFQDAKYTDADNTGKKQALLDMTTGESGLAPMYAAMFESKDTKERNTISYAREQGVRPSAFVKREIQKAGEHGMPGEPEEDAIWEDGKIVVDEHGTTVSGTKKAQVCDNLLNSGYTEKEKAFFYQKEYGTDGNFPYYAAAGLPVDDYLSVKGYTATLKADKDENGKSISGSKKEKLTEFLESSGMSEEQKLFFFAQNYKISGKEAQAVRDYIGGLNASDEVKEKLLESVQLGGGSGRKGSGGRKSGGTSKALQEKGAKLALKERLGPDVGTLPELDWDILTKGKSQQTSAAADTGVLPYYVQAMADVNKSIASRSKQTELENVDLSPWLVTAKQKANARRMIKNRYER